MSLSPIPLHQRRRLLFRSTKYVERHHKQPRGWLGLNLTRRDAVSTSQSQTMRSSTDRAISYSSSESMMSHIFILSLQAPLPSWLAARASRFRLKLKSSLAQLAFTAPHIFLLSYYHCAHIATQHPSATIRTAHRPLLPSTRGDISDIGTFQGSFVLLISRHLPSTIYELLQPSFITHSDRKHISTLNGKPLFSSYAHCTSLLHRLGT